MNNLHITRTARSKLAVKEFDALKLNIKFGIKNTVIKRMLYKPTVLLVYYRDGLTQCVQDRKNGALLVAHVRSGS